MVIGRILSPSDVKAIRDIAGHLAFREGKESAGGLVARVKKNQQAVNSEEVAGILATVPKRLSEHPKFTSATRPKAFVNMLMSRYDTGGTYGWHVDNAMMGGARTDISFILFLNDRQSYDGGSLMIRDTLETRQIKLEAGDLILDPPTTLHHVEPVTRGQRLVILGWVQSLIARADQHEILFDLDRAIDSIASPEPTEAQDLLSKTRSNLLRRLVDCQALRPPADGIWRALSPACQDTRFCGKIRPIRKR